MIAAERTVLILLAAGRSSRFPGGNKLEQDLHGTPVGLHAARTLAPIAFLGSIAVVGGNALDYAPLGFTIVRNDAPELGMARSLRLAIERAKEFDPDAVLVALADMPSITEGHVRRLLAEADCPGGVAVSSDGELTMPPVVFGRAHLEHLSTLSGDRGARDLVAAGRRVIAGSGELIDIDTPDDLARLRARPEPRHDVPDHAARR